MVFANGFFVVLCVVFLLCLLSRPTIARQVAETTSEREVSTMSSEEKLPVELGKQQEMTETGKKTEPKTETKTETKKTETKKTEEKNTDNKKKRNTYGVTSREIDLNKIQKALNDRHRSTLTQKPKETSEKPGN